MSAKNAEINKQIKNNNVYDIIEGVQRQKRSKSGSEEGFNSDQMTHGLKMVVVLLALFLTVY